MIIELSEIELESVVGGIGDCHPKHAAVKPKPATKPKAVHPATAPCGPGSALHFDDHQTQRTVHLVIDETITTYDQHQWG